jgi:PPP family 3-phenylpropionic acid transporter
MTSPYWSLSTFYFFFFAVVGAMLPFWPLYLESLGFGPLQIGTLVALVMATKIVAPNVWGWVADRRGRRMALVRMACFAAVLIFAAVLVSTRFWWLALLMVLFSFFWNSALPQFEAVTLNHLTGRVERYTRIRLWGSVGFVAAVMGLGGIVDHDGAGAVPYVILSLLACVAISSLLAGDAQAPSRPGRHGSLLAVLRKPPVVALLVACLLMQAGHGPYYTFYSIYLEEHGYPPTAIGGLWALGVAAEVVVFVFMPRLVAWAGLRPLFLLAFGLTALRWVMVAFLVESAPAMVLAQLLHAASFGLYHGVAIQLVHRQFTASHQGRGQALYSSISFGAGGAAGALLAGYAWGSVGSTATWVGAAALSALALLVAWRFVVVPAPPLVHDNARFPLQ